MRVVEHFQDGLNCFWRRRNLFGKVLLAPCWVGWIFFAAFFFLLDVVGWVEIKTRK